MTLFTTKRFTILAWIVTGMTILTVISGCAGAGAGGGENGGDALPGVTWQQLAKLIGNAAAHEQAGFSVAMDENTAIVGVPGDDIRGYNAGSAYVFVRDGSGLWSRTDTLTASDAGENDIFGSSVALSGDFAIVGAPLHNGPTDNPFDTDGISRDSGAAYVFVRSGDSSWNQEAKLTGNRDLVIADDNFGSSVAISGDTAIVGSPYDEKGTANPDSGAAYVFRRNDEGNWPQEIRLSAADASAGDQFGSQVAISGYSAIVGAPFSDDGGNSSGSAYIFTRNGSWSQTKLSVNVTAGNQLGFGVAIDGDTAIAGAPGGGDNYRGLAYVFTRDAAGSWNLSDTLSPVDATEGACFGWSVAIDGDSTIVGAVGDGAGGFNSGAAFVFTRSAEGAWTQSGKLTAADAVAHNWFGHSVAISGQSAVVGVPRDDDGAQNSGAAYFFALR